METPRHILEWDDLVRKDKILVVEAARDHAKSWFFSRSLPIYRIFRHHDYNNPINIALVSYSEDQATKNLKWIRDRVEDTEDLKWLLPRKKSQTWDIGELNFSNGCTIVARGFGSSFRGGHYHLIVVDDPTKDHWTMTLNEQENFFFSVLIPAVRKDGQLIVTGNPVEMQDLLWVLENNPQYRVHKYPVFNEKNQPLWPEHYSHDDIEAKRRMIPAHLFSREYLLKRTSPIDAKFREEWIKYYELHRINPESLYRIMTIDPALSPGGDYLSAVVTGTDYDKNTFVLDRMSFRGDFKTGIDKLCDLIVEHNPHIVGIETFAFQKMYKIWLEEEMEKRNISVSLTELGKDSRKTKAARIESLQPKISHGKLLFLREHKHLIDQLLLWDPTSRTNEDDEIDALAWQIQLWESPADDNPIKVDVVPGSFMDDFKNIQMENNQGYIGKLFEEFHA